MSDNGTLSLSLSFVLFFFSVRGYFGEIVPEKYLHFGRCPLKKNPAFGEMSMENSCILGNCQWKIPAFWGIGKGRFLHFRELARGNSCIWETVHGKRDEACMRRSRSIS